MATATAATGRVIQITGPVVDIEFPAGQLPKILNAVEIQREGQDSLVCEVQQHLGNNWVRSVAMTTTDGLARGVAVAMVWVASCVLCVSERSRRTRSRSSRG